VFEQAVNERLLLVLKELSQYSEITGRFYFAGGTALALQRGHRKSEDQDFITSEPFNTNQVVAIVKEMGGTIKLDVKQTVHMEVNEAKISFLLYSYPLLRPVERMKEVFNSSLASIDDIACMKLMTVAQRGDKKDFYDVFEILKIKSLASLKEMMIKKCGEQYANLYGLARSLVYFKDAEESLIPKSMGDHME
jgi:predicted nucleotidyltransferase component of viral defense system